MSNKAEKTLRDWTNLVKERAIARAPFTPRDFRMAQSLIDAALEEAREEERNRAAEVCRRIAAKALTVPVEVGATRCYEAILAKGKTK